MKRAIINTLCYADIFNYPLRLSEIHQFLIHSHQVNLSAVKTHLRILIKEKKVGHSEIWFYLPKRAQTVSYRNQSNILAAAKQHRARKLIRFLSYLPTIKAIFLTGGLAVGNAKRSDDIDLMIVTRANTLWITRLLANSILDTLGLRRRPETQDVANKLCLNLWLDETALAVPKEKQNLYTAHEVVQAQCLFDRGKMHERFLLQNRWLRQFLPNISLSQPSENISKINHQHPTKNPLELFAYHLQLSHMRRRLTNEKITPHIAFFHPRNTQAIILNAYQERVKKYNR